ATLPLPSFPTRRSSDLAYLVLKTILTPKLDLKPGIFRYETVLRGEWEVPLIALLLTLTPGSVVMEVMPEGNVFYVHAMEIEKYRSEEHTSELQSRFDLV